MNIKQLVLASVLGFGSFTAVQAADQMHDFDFQEAVNRAVAD